MGLVTAPSVVAGATSPTTTVYDSTDPASVALPSQPYEATQATEIGNQVVFAAGTSRTLNNVVVSFDSWGCGTSGGWSTDDCVTSPGATFAQPVTLNLYAANSDNTPGALITTVTQTVNLAYRPSADNTNCTGANAGKWFNAANSACYNGMVTNATLSLGDVTVPNKVIYGVEIRTSDYGDPAIGGSMGDATACHASSTGCPYDSLNVALSLDPTNVTVGSNALTNGLYWATGDGAFYCDGGAGGVGTFRFDSGCWGDQPPYLSSPYDVPAVQFNAEATCTTACYVSPAGSDTNAGTSDSPFATIQHAVTTVASGGTVNVAAGTYNENVHITQPVTLLGANAGVPGTSARGSESVISTGNVTGNDDTVQVSSAGVTVNGFTLQQTAQVTCPFCAAFGVQLDANASGATINDNIITGMSVSGSSPRTLNPIGVNVASSGSTTPNNVTIGQNLIESISSAGTQHTSALGIEVGAASTVGVGTGLLISGNHITGVSDAGWGAYGIIANRPTSGSQILGNTIDTISGGGWSRGIGLEASETNPTVSNNDISGITSTNPAPGSADDLYFDGTDTSSATSTVSHNSFAGATSAGVLNLSPGTVNVTTNWWGCAGGPNASGCSGTGGTGSLTFNPWIVSFTPDPTKAGQPGFWPTLVTVPTNTATITSAPSVQLAQGKHFTFTVTTGGNPVATLSTVGLPGWVTFSPGMGNKAGTAKLAGVAPQGGGTYTFTINANNGNGYPVTGQTFTIYALGFSSPASVNFSKSGGAQSFTVHTIGARAGVSLSGALGPQEAGLTFHDNGNGTATISGTPVAPARTHVVKITAVSGAASTSQKLTVGITP